MCEQLSAAEERQLTLCRKNAVERIAAFLLTMAERSNAQRESAGTTVRLPMNRADIADYLALTTTERAITSLPLFYSYGLSVLNSHLLVGASLVQSEVSVLERDFWQQMEQHGVSGFAGAPFT